MFKQLAPFATQLSNVAKISVIMPDGRKVETEECYKLKCKIENLSVDLDLFVLDIMEDVILGADFFTRYDFKLDYGSMIAQICTKHATSYV